MGTIRKGILVLDPRTKILLLLGINIFVFTNSHVYAEMLVVAALVILLLLCGVYKTALKSTITYIVLLAIKCWILPFCPEIIMTSLNIVVITFRKLEVYEFLDRADHKAENLSHEQRRHWDGREFDEYIVATEGVGIYGETPEEYLCRMETLGELMAVLDTCTEAQRRRFLLYALEGLSYAEIGTICGCSKYSVRDSIIAVRKIFKDFFENRPHE